MSGLHLTAGERQAIVDGTDPVSLRHRFRAPLTPDGEVFADLPEEREFSLDDWQDDLVDREPEDRTLVDEMPPGYCPSWWGSGL